MRISVGEGLGLGGNLILASPGPAGILNPGEDFRYQIDTGGFLPD